MPRDATRSPIDPYRALQEDGIKQTLRIIQRAPGVPQPRTGSPPQAVTMTSSAVNEDGEIVTRHLLMTELDFTNDPQSLTKIQ